MFTGIVEEIGTIGSITSDGDSARVRVDCQRVVSDAQHGASIAVNGVCLTVVEHDDHGFSADVMGETLKCSSLGALRGGSLVNLERAVTADTRLSGHIVQGHVDGTGEITERTDHSQWEVVRLAIPAQLAGYVVEKGSITIDGISLTISGVSEPAEMMPWLEVSLIPTTRELTTLGSAAVGTVVNLEVDVLAKYIERQQAVAAARIPTMDAVPEQEMY